MPLGWVTIWLGNGPFTRVTVEPRYKNIIGPAHRILIEEVFLYKGN